MSVDTRIISETPSQGQFRISVHDAQKIYHEAMSSLANRELIPSIDTLGDESFPEGLFSSMSAQIDLYIEVPEVNGYSFSTHADYRNPKTTEYWNSIERETLLQAMQALYGQEAVRMILCDDDSYYLSIHDAQNEAQFIMKLGWENEGAKWLGQVKTINTLLKRELLLEHREELEKSLNYLIRNPDPVEDTSYTFMGYVSSNMDPQLTFDKENALRGLLELTDVADFKRKLDRFREMSETTVNVVSAIKAQPQQGNFVLKATNY